MATTNAIEQTVIPLGYCQCGCGEKTKLAPQTDTKHGLVRGVPYLRVETRRKRCNESGVILLVELLVVCVVSLVILAASVVSFMSLRNIQNQVQARQQVVNVSRAVIEQQLCTQQNAIQVGTCLSNPAVAALIPAIGSQTFLNYTFTYANNNAGVWSYQAIPKVSSMMGYSENQTGIIVCVPGGQAC